MPKFNWKHFLAFAATGIASSLVATFYTASVVSYWAGGVPKGAITIQSSAEHHWREWISAGGGYAGGLMAVIAAGLTIIYLRKQIREAKRSNDFQNEQRIMRMIAVLYRQLTFISEVQLLSTGSVRKLMEESSEIAMTSYVLNYNAVSAHLQEMDQVIEIIKPSEYELHTKYMNLVRTYTKMLGAVFGANPENLYGVRLEVDETRRKVFSENFEAFTKTVADKKTPDEIRVEYGNMIRRKILFYYKAAGNLKLDSSHHPTSFTRSPR